ncbi:endo alpha-1,4 polygalactosaminidase [Flavobacterium suzhouense]|uniref:Endo alpha-1,4 polygalactosaminidase n=1 Tax=Flavobacterium suzhouense TaxID=1529638 RepID=A0ABW5NZX5_9FLAO
MRVLIFLVVITLFTGCDSSDSDSGNNNNENRDYKQDMRDLVIGISQKAKAMHSGFAIIPQNGIELVTTTGEASGSPATEYLDAIDGNGQEDFLYGYDNDDETTPASVTSYLKGFLDISKNAGNTILAIDYCSSPSKTTHSYEANNAFGYVSFAAPERSLNIIPASAPVYENASVITALSQAKNFLYLINPENFASKTDFINAVTATNYDAVIMDLFLNDEAFTASEISQLKNKANGGKRLVICYMSIGEAEDYRYYWQSSWNGNKPDWIAAENPDWPGNFKVKYWNDDWQGIIYRNNDSYLNKIILAGFDGVYLDIIDAFEYFE